MRSVVLASCEGEKYIGAQLESILPQLATDDEIVISDDASTDRTLQMIAAQGDGRIRVIANEHRAGYVANFQRAIAHSRGDLIFFSDQDDIWLPHKVTTLEAALRNHALAASDATVVDHDLQTLYRSYFEWRGARDFSWRSIFLKPPIVGATMACHRPYLDTLMPFPDGIPHDFWLTLNAAWDNCLEVVRTPLILYRRHPAALSPSATNRTRGLRTKLSERLRLAIGILRRSRRVAVRSSWRSGCSSP
jgi:glycosyltransferase involved in cell wall biosynthesis